MLRSLAGLGVTLLIAYVALCLVLFALQRSLIYFPQPRSLPPGQAMATLRTADDTELVLTVRPREGEHALLYFGGNAEDVSLALPELAAAFPDHALALVHYRGYGGSAGRPDEAALHADALAAYDHLRARHARITVVGRSLGSGVAVRLAARREVERLVLVTPYRSILELAQQQFPFVPVRWLLRDTFESWRDAPQVRAPVTLVIAEHDEVIPPASAHALRADFMATSVRTVVIAGAGHNDLSERLAYKAALAGH